MHVCFRQVCATRVVVPSKARSDSLTISLNAACTSKEGNPCHLRRHTQTWLTDRTRSSLTTRSERKLHFIFQVVIPAQGLLFSRSESDGRNHPDHRANNSIRRIFSADIFDEQEQRIYGESTPAEFLSRRTCPCRRYRDSRAHLPGTCRLGRAADSSPLVRSNRGAARCNSYFGWLLLFRASTGCDSSQRSGLPDLRWSSRPCASSRFARHWLGQGRIVRST